LFNIFVTTLAYNGNLDVDLRDILVCGFYVTTNVCNFDAH